MNKNMYIDAGNRIRRIRESNHYTREYVAARARISPKFLYEIEIGTKGFSADTLFRISKALNVSSEYILSGRVALDLERELSEALELFTSEQLKEITIVLKSLYKTFNP